MNRGNFFLQRAVGYAFDQEKTTEKKPFLHAGQKRKEEEEESSSYISADQVRRDRMDSLWEQRYFEHACNMIYDSITQNGIYPTDFLKCDVIDYLNEQKEIDPERDELLRLLEGNENSY